MLKLLMIKVTINNVVTMKKHFTLLALAIVVVNLWSCASTAPKPVVKNLAPVVAEKYTLMPHQARIVHYMNDNPHIHGVLINHYMGTGKTLTALAAAASQTLPIAILAPDFLKDNWFMQMEQFGIDHSRFRFFGFNEAGNGPVPTFDNTFLIIDEAHNFLPLINNVDQQKSSHYVELYHNARAAARVIALTGTPIYSDIADISVLINLVAGDDLITFNRERFRATFAQKKPWWSFARGHLSESNILFVGVPTFFAFLGFALVATPLVIVPACGLGAAIIPLFKTLTPVDKYPLKVGNYESLTPILNRYVSYFRVAEDTSDDFPTYKIVERAIPYNDEQMALFLRYVEEDLNVDELIMFLRETMQPESEEKIKIEQSAHNHRLKQVPGHGREIGNMPLKNNAGASVAPPKFEAMLTEIQKAKGRVAIYSSYVENGTKAFYNFLAARGYGDRAVLVDPKEPVRLQSRKIAAYNNGEKSIILFNFAEGINLKETRQLHLMEPVLNQATYEQAIGRAVRYQSHQALPKDQRHVDVFAWHSTLPFSMSAFLARRENWRTRYGEMAQYAEFGRGITQVDKNFDEKTYSPDDYALMKLNSLRLEIRSINELMARTSLEHELPSARTPK